MWWCECIMYVTPTLSFGFLQVHHRSCRFWFWTSKWYGVQNIQREASRIHFQRCLPFWIPRTWWFVVTKSQVWANELRMEVLSVCVVIVEWNEKTGCDTAGIRRQCCWMYSVWNTVKCWLCTVSCNFIWSYVASFYIFCSGAMEDSSLQGYGALSVGYWYQTYQHSMRVWSDRIKRWIILLGV